MEKGIGPLSSNTTQKRIIKDKESKNIGRKSNEKN
jgi:hypothetical protein